jgi:hypothetical protein
MTGFLTLLTTLPTQVQCLYTFKSICGITSKNGINFKLRAGWGIAGFASYPVANTIDGVARNFDISGVVSFTKHEP